MEQCQATSKRRFEIEPLEERIAPTGAAMDITKMNPGGNEPQGQANGKAIDTTGEFAFTDGLKSFKDFPELVAHMVQNQNTHGCYASKLAEFALARDMAGGDGTLVTALQQDSLTKNSSIKDMLIATIQDATFVVAKGGAP